jgi:hypothetical protein
MSKTAILQAKVATLSEPIAEEVLDFLELVTARRQLESRQKPDKVHQLRGVFKGRLSSSHEFAARKSDEIRLEK